MGIVHDEHIFQGVGQSLLPVKALRPLSMHDLLLFLVQVLPAAVESTGVLCLIRSLQRQW